MKRRKQNKAQAGCLHLLEPARLTKAAHNNTEPIAFKIAFEGWPWKACQRAIRSEYSLFALHCNYTRPYCVSAAEDFQMQMGCILSFIYNLHPFIWYLQNITLNIGAERFKANESDALSECFTH